MYPGNRGILSPGRRCAAIDELLDRDIFHRGNGAGQAAGRYAQDYGEANWAFAWGARLDQGPNQHQGPAHHSWVHLLCAEPCERPGCPTSRGSAQRRRNHVLQDEQPPVHDDAGYGKQHLRPDRQPVE